MTTWAIDFAATPFEQWCAVVQKSNEVLGNTHTCVLMLPQRRNKRKCVPQARHQADNLAKLWFEFLSVLELIAQILCAVAVQKSSEALGNTHTCVLMLPQRRFLHKIAILRAESKLRKLNSMSFETHSAIKPHFAPPDSYVAPLL